MLYPAAEGQKSYSRDINATDKHKIIPGRGHVIIKMKFKMLQHTPGVNVEEL